ncbi:hypothetical protein QBC39DRAFT_405102 [Podospora conica]|nr:hypothetical protein QBC39DRAFT_405102 [Schizothecium conicum]
MAEPNPLTTFAHHINNHIALGFQSVLGLPSVVSRGWTTTPTSNPTPPSTNPPPPSSSPPSNNNNNNDPFPPFDPTNLQSPGEHLACALIDSLAALGTFLGASAAWTHFLTISPYSPILLDFSHLPSPRPATLPPSSASYQRAFEDLLRASSGLPLTTPSDARAYRRGPRGSRRAFLHAVHLYERALKARGGGRPGEDSLAEVYFPFATPVPLGTFGPVDGTYRTPTTVAEWEEQRRAMARRAEALERHGEAAGRAVRERVAAAVAAMRRQGLGPGLGQGPETEEDLYAAETPRPPLVEIVGGKEHWEVEERSEDDLGNGMVGEKVVRRWVDEDGSLHEETRTVVRDKSGVSVRVDGGGGWGDGDQSAR